jgi:hypothetical protein
VNSYALQGALIQEGITDEMLNGLDDLDVVGLAVLPDALRKPMGVEGPIVTAADWQGITFGTLGSNLQVDAIRALGARPLEVFGQERTDALEAGMLQGFEFGMHAYATSPEWLQSAPYVTANVNLWPQMDVLLADPSRLAELTDEQQGWLHQAAEEAASDASGFAESDAENVATICDAGARFATASDTDLVALQTVFEPVYVALERTPETKAFIDRIRDLKETTPAEAALVIPDSCTGPANTEAPTVPPGNAPAFLKGTYEHEITQEDAAEAGDPDGPRVDTITLQDGRLEGGCFGDGGGSYSVEGDRITFHSDDYNDDFTVTFSRAEDGTLTLTPVPPMDPGDAFTCFHNPWTKVG